jgi:hypothetical protein
MTVSPARTPVRIAFTPDDHRSRQHVESLLDGFESRVEVLRTRGADAPDLVLFDPCADGVPLDLTRFPEVGGDAPLVVYTPVPAVDTLAFAMAGSLMDGRLRGWLSHDLPPVALVDAIERIHRGHVVVESDPTGRPPEQQS